MCRVGVTSSGHKPSGDPFGLVVQIMCDLNQAIKIKCNQQCIKEVDRKRSTAQPTWQISCICFEQ